MLPQAKPPPRIKPSRGVRGQPTSTRSMRTPLQTQATANHAGIANFETMRIVRGNLNRSAGAICFAGSRDKHRQQPIAGDLSNQIIRAAQSQILSDVGSPPRPRARFGFGQAQGPCLVEFAQPPRNLQLQTSSRGLTRYQSEVRLFDHRFPRKSAADIEPCSLTKARDVIMALQNVSILI